MKEESANGKVLTLYLLGQKGYHVLSSIVESGYSSLIQEVVIGRDLQILEDYYDQIKHSCEKAEIAHSTRKGKDSPKSKYFFAVSWKWMIEPGESIGIVFHDSLLPKYRGFNPLVTALINGDESIGVTALFAKEAYDSGPIVSQSEATISYPIKIQEAIDLICVHYKKLAVQLCKQIANSQEVVGTTQDEKDASYSLWRDEEDYRINWAEDAEYIKRFIDAVGSPYLGASSFVNEFGLVRILDCEALADVKVTNRHAGKVLFMQDGKPIVVCGSGLLRINHMTNEAGDELLPMKKFRIRFQ